MAQIQKSIILKCRQSESTGDYGNGNYTTNLKKPTILEEGDVVKIHTAILDTSTTGLVQVIGDLDPITGISTGEMSCSIDIVKYNTIYQIVDIGTPAAPLPVIDFLPASPLTYERYFACIGKGAPANTFIITKFDITPLSVSGLAKFGDCQLTFEFEDPVTGGLVQKQKYFKGGRQFNHPNGIELTLNWPVVATGLTPAGLPIPTTVRLVNSKEYLKKHFIGDGLGGTIDRNSRSTSYSGPIPLHAIVCQPFIETLNFSIREGRYTPGEIATIINDQMGAINVGGGSLVNEPQNGKFPINNPFLSTARQLAAKALLPPYDTNPPGGNTIRFFPNIVPGSGIVNITHQVTYNIGTLSAGTPPLDNPAGSGLDLIVGAEQVSLNFDPILKKLNFDIMHTPIYVGGTLATQTAVPGIQFNEDGGVVNVYGGAAIVGLSPEDFWTSQLGFQNILVPWELETTPFRTAPLPGGENVYGVRFTPVIGQHITSVFDNMDLIVPKNPNFFFPSTPFVAPTGGGLGRPIPGVATSLTKGIIASREFDTGPDDEGYFLIEVGFKFPQSMIGGQVTNSNNATMNNIQSIVGKYYTSGNNFLQDTGAGSITYEHHGEPQIITDLTIRVLQPNGLVPEPIDLGPRNSIFIEIVKSLNISPK